MKNFGLTREALPGLLITVILAAIGGAIAVYLHLPLGWLLGALGVTAVAAGAGWRPLGHAIVMPTALRMTFVPVIGVALGGAFTPEIAREALTWGTSIAALFVFIPIVHWMGYQIYRRGGLSRKDAFFGAVPGGLLESVQLGEDAGADVRLLTVLQFLRLILTIIAVPLIFLVLTGNAVGSAAGVQIGEVGASLTGRDVALLLACGILGALLGRALRLPGWMVTGPLALSAIAHGTGFVHGVPPAWLIAVTQVMLGAGLGARFAGVEMSLLRRAGILAVINGAAALLMAFLFALMLPQVMDESPAAIFLAFAPGGLAEMSLIALSLQASGIFVSVHHVVRIMLSVLAAQIGAKRLARSGMTGPPPI